MIKVVAAITAIVMSVTVFANENIGRLNGSADYAFINGHIYTMDSKAPWAEAVAIEGNKITYYRDN